MRLQEVLRDEVLRDDEILQHLFIKRNTKQYDTPSISSLSMMQISTPNMARDSCSSMDDSVELFAVFAAGGIAFPDPHSIREFE